MALPLLPIILAVTALGSGIVQGISSVQNAKAEAKAVAEQYSEQANERARQAKKLMQQQKTSFLKSGVYFDSGSPMEVINETYDTMEKDISSMKKDADTQISNLMRQGKTAFFSSIVESMLNAGMGYVMGGGTGFKALGAIQGTTTANSVKNKLQNLYQTTTGKYRGGFTTTSSNRIV